MINLHFWIGYFFDRQGEKHRHPVGWRGFSTQHIGKRISQKCKFIIELYLSLVVVFSIIGCQPNQNYYKKEFTETEQLELTKKLLNGLGYRNYYQGSVGEQMLLEEAAIHNNEHPEVWREKGIPYLKRGIASGYFPNYGKCVYYDSLGWQGWRGYCTLYFYRDYGRALTDFNELDILTPNFIDHPQGTSIDYMRGICYFGLGQYQKSLDFMDKHLASESKGVGYEYVYPVTFILKGLAHKKLGDLDKAQAAFELGIANNEQNADLEYQLAKLFHEKGATQKALKWLKKSRESFQEGYFNSRNYVEEFQQVYLADIDDLEKMIDM